MENGKEILHNIMRTTQIGQAGLQCILKIPISTSLRSALHSQLAEFDSIAQEARAIAFSRGWILEELHPIVVYLIKLTIWLRFALGCTDYKVASINIEGNTKGMIKGLRDMHQFNKADRRLYALSQKLLDCEKANVQQMQGFL